MSVILSAADGHGVLPGAGKYSRAAPLIFRRRSADVFSQGIVRSESEARLTRSGSGQLPQMFKPYPLFSPCCRSLLAGDSPSQVSMKSPASRLLHRLSRCHLLHRRANVPGRETVLLPQFLVTGGDWPKKKMGTGLKRDPRIDAASGVRCHWPNRELRNEYAGQFSAFSVSMSGSMMPISPSDARWMTTKNS